VNITEVRVKLMQHRNDRLRAFCSITIDNDFVVHDLRVIEGRKGLFVAMPSRKLSDACSRCGAKNELRAKFCSDCGQKLPEGRAETAVAAREKLHVDVAHPINTPCREGLQRAVLEAYDSEQKRAQAGLEPLHEYPDEGLDDLADDYGETLEEGEPGREGKGDAAAGPRARPESAERDAAAPEEAERTAGKPRRSQRPAGGGFGEGVF